MQNETSKNKTQLLETKNENENQQYNEDAMREMHLNGRHWSLTFHNEEYCNHLATLIPDGIRANANFNNVLNINDIQCKKGC